MVRKKQGAQSLLQLIICSCSWLGGWGGSVDPIACGNDRHFHRIARRALARRDAKMPNSLRVCLYTHMRATCPAVRLLDRGEAA